MRGFIRGSGEKKKYFVEKGGRTGRVEVTKVEFDELFPSKPITSGEDLRVATEWRKPVISNGASVHPDEIPEYEQNAAKHGVPTEFTKDGRPVFRSRQHRRDYLKSIGVHDRDGGFGDG